MTNWSFVATKSLSSLGLTLAETSMIIPDVLGFGSLSIAIWFFSGLYTAGEVRSSHLFMKCYLSIIYTTHTHISYKTLRDSPIIFDARWLGMTLLCLSLLGGPFNTLCWVFAAFTELDGGALGGGDCSGGECCSCGAMRQCLRSRETQQSKKWCEIMQHVVKMC